MLEEWLDRNPTFDTFFVCAPDVNGVMRGKALPVTDWKKIERGGTRMALSSSSVDIRGEDIEGCSKVVETGDCDAVMRLTGRKPIPSVLNPRSAYLPMDFWMEDGSPSGTGCRHALIEILERFGKKAWQPVVALEFEFYLFDLSNEGLEHPLSPLNGVRLSGRENGHITDLEHFSVFLEDIRRHCKAGDITITAINSENSTGMFEVNLDHSDDVLKAVDDSVFMRRIIRDTALAHGLGATFMAKPFPHLDGAGLHMHVSLPGADSHNLFDNGGPKGTDLLESAVAGLLEHTNAMQIIMAPHISSFRRIQPNAYAPTAICWGYDNRSVPVRIPGGDVRARRIEHRLASADANPYLVTLAVLAAALDGIERQLKAPAPVAGFAYDQGYPNVVANMRDALRLFEASDWTKTMLPPLFHEAFVKCKYQEMALFDNQVTPLEIQTYRDRV